MLFYNIKSYFSEFRLFFVLSTSSLLKNFNHYLLLKSSQQPWGQAGPSLYLETVQSCLLVITSRSWWLHQDVFVKSPAVDTALVNFPCGGYINDSRCRAGFDQRGLVSAENSPNSPNRVSMSKYFAPHHSYWFWFCHNWWQTLHRQLSQMFLQFVWIK